MKTLTLYHGTRHPSLSSFRSSEVGRGGDANSALGVFLCEAAASAVEYADPDFHNGIKALSGDGRVLVVEVDVSNCFIVDRISDFLGIDEWGERERTHEDFAAARERLLEKGHDCIATDSIDELDGIWVVLDPSRTRVVGCLDVETASTMEERVDWSAVSMIGGDLFPEPAAAAKPR
jgi:hypothetical protein